MKNEQSITDALQWLKAAQDHSKDGGVAAWNSLVTGWAPSYIETTGYIINTFLEAARYYKNDQYLSRAKKMGDFLVSMQHESGGYRTHVPEVKAISEPTVFNTGQDLLGMCELYTVTNSKKYLTSFSKAADFLVSIQEKDGSWLKYTYGNKTHVYHTRVAWGLLECWKITGKEEYHRAATKNLNWALTYQQPNGWYSNNELPPPNIQLPYTHTISYAIEGFLWSGLLLNDKKYIDSAIKAALPPLKYFLIHDFMPGTFDKNWKSSDGYSCLTGDAQLAVVWLALYKLTKYPLFKTGGDKMITYLQQQQQLSAVFGNKGALAGSSPLWGDIHKNKGYCRFAYLNWATKFYVDALFLEQSL